MKITFIQALARVVCGICVLLLPIGVLAQTTDSVKTYSKTQRLLVSAPANNPESLLGDGFDAQLKKLDKALTQPSRETAANEYKIEAFNLDDEMLLQAYMPLFGIAGITPQKTKRYSLVRMYHVVKNREISLLTADAHKGTEKLIATRIGYGFAVNLLLEGDSTTLTANISSKLLAIGGDMLKEAAKRGVHGIVLTMGAESKTKGAFPSAASVQEFEKKFQKGRPQPILIEHTVMNEFTSKHIPFDDGKIHAGAWIVRSVKVQVEQRKPNGSHWDPLLGKPDLIVSVEMGQTNYNKSKLYKNSLTADWKDCNTQITLNKGNVLQVSVIDKDPEGDDYVGAISITTDRIFGTYEPGQEIYLTVKDDKSAIKSAVIILEKAPKK